MGACQEVHGWGLGRCMGGGLTGARVGACQEVHGWGLARCMGECPELCKLGPNHPQLPSQAARSPHTCLWLLW